MAQRRISREERRRRRRRKRMMMMLLSLLLCIGVGVAAVKLVLNTFAREKAVITIMAEPVTIRQEQEIPEMKVNILVSGEEDAVLDRKSKYKVSNLVEEIKKGEHYQITNEADNTKEVKFPLKVTLKDEMKEKLEGKFKGRVEIKTKNGTMTVKNKRCV